MDEVDSLGFLWTENGWTNVRGPYWPYWMPYLQTSPFYWESIMLELLEYIKHIQRVFLWIGKDVDIVAGQHTLAEGRLDMTWAREFIRVQVLEWMTKARIGTDSLVRDEAWQWVYSWWDAQQLRWVISTNLQGINLRRMTQVTNSRRRDHRRGVRKLVKPQDGPVSVL